MSEFFSPFANFFTIPSVNYSWTGLFETCCFELFNKGTQSSTEYKAHFVLIHNAAEQAQSEWFQMVLRCFIIQVLPSDFLQFLSFSLALEKRFHSRRNEDGNLLLCQIFPEVL